MKTPEQRQPHWRWHPCAHMPLCGSPLIANDLIIDKGKAKPKA